MVKSALLFLGLAFSSFASAAPSHAEIFDQLTPILREHRVSEMELCLDQVCETYTNLVWDRKTVSDKPGANDTVGAEGHGAAEAVGGIVGQIGKQVGAGGRFSVEYEKKADGTLRIKVEGSFGVGSAAAAAASASPPDKKDL